MSKIIFFLSLCAFILTTGNTFAQSRKILSNVPYQSCNQDDTVSVSNIYLFRTDAPELADKEVRIYFQDSLLTTLKNNTYVVYVTSSTGPVKVRSEMDGKASELSFLVQPGRVYYVQSAVKGKKMSKIKPALHVTDPHYAYPYITEIRKNSNAQ